MNGSEDSAGAGETLAEAAMAALGRLAGLNGAYDGPPLQAVHPFAVVEAGPETDWSHKSGEGREVRLAVTIRDKGERPTRPRRLMREAEAALASIAGGDTNGWQIVTLAFFRSRLVPGTERGWAGVLDYRARMLRT